MRYRKSHLNLVRHGRIALRRTLIVAGGEHRRHQRCQHQLQRCFVVLGSVQLDLSRGSLDRIESRIVGSIRSQLIFTRGLHNPIKVRLTSRTRISAALYYFSYLSEQ